MLTHIAANGTFRA